MLIGGVKIRWRRCRVQGLRRVRKLDSICCTIESSINSDRRNKKLTKPWCLLLGKQLTNRLYQKSVRTQSIIPTQVQYSTPHLLTIRNRNSSQRVMSLISPSPQLWLVKVKFLLRTIRALQLYFSKAQFNLQQKNCPQLPVRATMKSKSYTPSSS